MNKLHLQIWVNYINNYTEDLYNAQWYISFLHKILSDFVGESVVSDIL